MHCVCSSLLAALNLAMADAPMRIDFIITELFVGGAERCLAELAIGLTQAGDHVRVASLASLPTGQQAALVDRLRRHGIPVDSANCDRPFQVWRGYRWLQDWLRQGQPDVVQTMLFHANVVGTFAARSAGVPICVGGIRVAERKSLRLLIERQAIRRMDAVVCVSRSVERFVQDVFGNPLPPLVTIGNAIDFNRVDQTATIDWQAWGWPADAQVLLFIGRLHRQKGVDVLIQTLQPLLAQHPTMRCLIVGDGPMRTELQQVAQRFTAARVQLAGWRDDPLSLIKSSRMLVLPSRYEGMPNVILEAMALGKPVAATHVEGVVELLGDQSRLQTCSPADPVALRQLIDRLWSDPAQAQEQGRRNRQRAVENHPLGKLIMQHRDLYCRLLPPIRCAASSHL